MERIVYRKTLDVHKGGIQFTLQGFTTSDNLSRRLEISFMASGDTVDFPLENTEAMIYVTTPRAQEPSIEKCEIKDNKIIYNMLPIIEEGITEMQIKVIGTSVSGAKSILGAPKFAIEVEKSNTDDEGAEQQPSFTALENAVAKAVAVYDSRLLRIEFDEVCVFRAYYADGTVYETDVIRRLLLQESTELNLNALVKEGIANFTTDEVAAVLADKLDERYRELFGKAMYVSDLLADFQEAMFVSWNAETENTPYKAGLTDITEGFALVYGEKAKNHAVTAWTKGGTGTNCFVYADGTWKDLLSSLADEGLAKTDLTNVDDKAFENKLKSVADDVFFEKMDGAGVLGTIRDGNDFYDVAMTVPYFYLTEKTSDNVFLTEDCIGFVDCERQAFYSRENNELLFEFTYDLDDANARLRHDYYEPGICILSKHSNDLAMYVFNYKTGVSKALYGAYGGFHRANYFGGRKGNSLYFWRKSADYTFTITELNIDTLEQIATREMTFQYMYNLIPDDSWTYNEGSVYKIRTKYADGIADGISLDVIDLSTGTYKEIVLINNAIDNSGACRILYLNKDTNEIYFYGCINSSYGFGKYNFETDSTTILGEDQAYPKYPDRYLGSISPEIAIMRYSDKYLREVNLSTGQTLKIATLVNDSSTDEAQNCKYFTNISDKYVPCNYNDSHLLNVNTFEMIGTYYISPSNSTMARPAFKRFGNEYVISSDKAATLVDYNDYYSIYDGSKPPEYRNIIRAVRRDT